MTDENKGEKNENTPANVERTPACRRRRLWVAAALALVVLTLALLPQGLRWGLHRWVSEQGAQIVQIGDVDFNPFAGRLVVKDFSAKNDRGALVEFEQFGVEIAWWALWQRRIHLESLSLTECSFDYSVADDGSWAIGPLEFSRQTAEKGDEEPWSLGIEGLALNGVRIDYHGPRLEKVLRIEEFTTDAFFSWHPEKTSRFRLQVMVDEGEISLDGQTRPFSSDRAIQTDVRVQKFPLAWLAPLAQESGITDLNATLEGDAKLSFGLDAGPGGGPSLVLDGKVQLVGMKGRTDTLLLRDGTLNWEGVLTWNGAAEGEVPLLFAKGEARAANLDLELASGESRYLLAGLSVAGSLAFRAETEGNALQGNVRASASDLRIDDLGQGTRLVRVAEMTIPSLQIGGIESLAADRLAISGLALFERPPDGEETRYIFRLDKLSAKAPKFEDRRRLNVSEIDLEGFSAYLVRNEKGTMELAHYLAGEETKEEDPAAAKENSFVFSADRLAVGEKSSLVFEDRSVAPAFRHAFSPFSLTVEDLDSRRPGQPSPVTLAGRHGRYATMDLSGTIRPFLDPAEFEFAGTLDAFDLPSLSPYTRAYIGYRLKSGHLRADLDWRFKEGVLDARSELRLAKLDVERLSQEEAEEMNRRLGLPLGSALGMLRDREDNIELVLNVNGTPTDPQFRVSEVVMTVLVQAINKGLVTYYAPMGLSMLTGAAVPLGATFVAGKLFDLVAGLRFEPFLFQPGGAELTEEDEERLAKMAQLLRDRPEVRLVLCGKAVAADREKGEKEKAEEGKMAIAEEERARLRALARQRAVVIKDYLIEQEVNGDRLFICDPQVEMNKDARPRVDVAI